MNNDLEQFSEERLKELSNINGNINTRFCDADIEALARIALSAKQAKPVGYISERNLNALGKQFSVCVKHEPVMVRPIPLYTTPQPAHTEQDDTRRMNWLCAHCVEVRDPQMYGSHAMFHAQQDSEEWDLPHHTTLREQIDKAMLAAAPKPESE